MHLITFILKALVTAIATALPQGIENNNQNQDQLDQTQPYHDQSLSEYTNYLKEAAQDTSAGDSLGSVNYVASSPNELNIPSIQDTSSGDNSAGLDELAQESITDTSNLDVPPTATYSERIPPFCDEKSELPSEHFNILVSRSKWKFMPNCGLYKEATCCSSFLKIEGGNVEGCTDDCKMHPFAYHFRHNLFKCITHQFVKSLN